MCDVVGIHRRFKNALCSILLLWILFEFCKCVGIDNSQKDGSRVYTLSDEKRLIKRLLNNYEDAGITGRPVNHTEERVIVNMSLSLIQILDLDEKNQVLTISVWLLFNWNDHILRWDPTNYSQVVEVRVPPKQIWTPDIVLYNYADERLKEMRDAMVIVKYDGSIKWMPPAIFKSNCKIDIKRFPFDEQICHMKFGSWTYDGNRLDMSFINNEQHVLLDDYTESNEWEIVARPAMRNVKYYPCCLEPYPDLTYFLFLKRNAAFFSYILVLPCVLLSSLTLVIFWLPPESPAKMVLGMNIFVAFFLLLLLLADSTPQASASVPYIGYYYCLNMVLITLSSFLSVIVINLYFRGDRRNRVPKWVRKVCLWMSKSCTDEDLGENQPSDSGQDEVQKTNTKRLNTIMKKNPASEKQNASLVRQPPVRKPTILVNGPHDQNALASECSQTINSSAARKTKKVKTRFATTNTQESEFIGGTVLQNDYPDKTYLLPLRSSEYVDNPLADRHMTDINLKKLRSRSSSPIIDDNPYITRTSDSLFKPTCLPTCTKERLVDANHFPLHGHTIEHVYKGSTTSMTTIHHKHPQSCSVCLQHLNKLKANSFENTTVLSPTLLSAPGYHPNNEVVIPASSRLDSIPPPCSPHQLSCFCNCAFNKPQCFSNPKHIRYEYRDGQTVLVPCVARCKPISNECISQSPPSNQCSDDTQAIDQMTKQLQSELIDIRQTIQSFLSRVSKKDAEQVIVREWRMVAMVLDRIFFFSYLIIHLCAAFGLMVPTSYEPNVIGFLRDYRLKHYNAVYTDEEAAALFHMALAQVPPENRVFGRSQDRLPPDELENASPDVASRTSNSRSEQANTLYNLEHPVGDSISSLSPYQRLVNHKQNSLSQPITSTSIISQSDEGYVAEIDLDNKETVTQV